MIVSRPCVPNGDRCRRGGCRVVIAGAYAFGGGGSGDSTRESDDDAALANALVRGAGDVSMLSVDGIATPIAHAAIAWQQFGTAVCCSGAESFWELPAP